MSVVGRLQSGNPENLLSGYLTVNQNDSGVVLHNMTTKDLQNDMGIYKTSNVSPVSGAVTGTVYYLLQPLIQNTLAAFSLGTAKLDPNAPYIGPATTPGQEGNRIWLYGPWLSKWDVGLVKQIPITERVSLEFRAQALNVLNFANFELYTNGATAENITIGTNFGQTAIAFRDFNNTNDPGSRPRSFLLSSVDVPAKSQITEASPKTPLVVTFCALMWQWFGIFFKKTCQRPKLYLTDKVWWWARLHSDCSALAFGCSISSILPKTFLSLGR